MIQKIFKVSRRAFVDPDILEARAGADIDKCWLYLGHKFRAGQARRFCHPFGRGRNILFARDARAISRRCSTPARTAARRSAGKNTAVPKPSSASITAGIRPRWNAPQPARGGFYAEDFKARSTSSMQQVARFESYRDLNFICFDKGVESLSDYLGPGEGISRCDLRPGRDGDDHSRAARRNIRCGQTGNC